MKYVLVFLFFVFSSIVHAQTCTSGLGDPIVNITFGSGTDFGPPLAAGITNMQYVKDQCPQDGTYTITSSTNNCFTGNWLNINTDHTGNLNGYFMLINASVQPSDFYVQTVSGLCPSTSYQFAAWVLNMASHSGEIFPNITFNIEATDGTVLKSFQTGDVPLTNPANWNQYAFYFTTPPGVSAIVLRMRNNAPGGYGNDLAIDDITFRTSGPSIKVSIAGHSGDTVILCPDLSNNLQFLGAVESCYPSTSYQWQTSTDNGGSWNNIPGAVNAVYSAFPTATGNYLYRLTAAQTENIGISTCQVVSAADSIVVLKTSYPAVSIGLNAAYVCVDSPATITATSVDGGPSPLYQWMLNGAPAGTGGPQYSSSVLISGDQVSCVMTSDAACPVPAATAVSNTLSMNITPHVVSSINITNSANNICHDSVVTFKAFPSNGGSQPSYQWMINGQPTGADTSIYSSGDLNNGDVISAVMTGNLPCSSPAASNAVAMTVYETPRINLTPDTIIAGGRYVILDPVITGSIVLHQWSPVTWLNDPGLLAPIASPVGTTTYELEVRNGLGCTASAKERVVVFYDLLMPNAFTPNGDGRNDLFRIPPSITVSIAKFSVYNRWGELVFTTANGSAGWDGRLGGKPQPLGTYVWMIDYYNPILKRQIMKKGTVELIR